MIRWISSLPGKPNYFIEPFAGGASVSLAVAQLNLSDKIILSEIDSELAAFWATVFSDSSLKLTKKISDLLILRADISRLLRAPGTDEVDIAFKCLVKNRMQHGGVLAPGAALLRSGEANKGLSSRWYPDTLISRIEALQKFRSKIKFFHEDAFDIIHRFASKENVVFFIDPPYTINGRGPGERLYRHSAVDPSRLFEAVNNVKGPILMCYHNSLEIRKLASKHSLHCVEIEMKSTHHLKRRELLIFNQGAPLKK